MAGVAALIGYLIATGTIVSGVVFLIGVVVFITAAGNTINDYYDAAIDAVNRPDRPIPSGEMSRKAALFLAAALFVISIALAIPCNALCLTIAIVNSGVLILYAMSLKRMPFIGNLAVSYLAGSIFLFGGALAGWEGLIMTAPVACITIAAMLSRELLKDAEDVPGDAAGGATTVPIRFGIRATVWLSMGFVLLAILASLVPVMWWGPLYLAGILPIDLVLLGAAALPLSCRDSVCVRSSHSTTLLKAGMFASLLVFAGSSLFL
jgi:geranylgeranylglycerol-phosphate geranylgeranyltransferase